MVLPDSRCSVIAATLLTEDHEFVPKDGIDAERLCGKNPGSNLRSLSVPLPEEKGNIREAGSSLSARNRPLVLQSPDWFGSRPGVPPVMQAYLILTSGAPILLSPALSQGV
jgi:hypothetical protein